MTRTATRRKPKFKRRRAPKPRGPRPMTDRAVYLGVGILGFFFVMLAWLAFDRWREPLLLYVAGVLYIVCVSVFQIYRGRHPAGWQQAMARIPLRFAGYGRKDGKPLEAAHHHRETRTVLLVCVVASVVILAGLALLLLSPFN